MRRLLAFLLLAFVLPTVLLTLSACGVRPSVAIGGGPAPTEEEITEGTVVYLLRGATLTRVLRPPAEQTPLELLAQGPLPEELAAGLTTEIPPYASPITAVPAAGGVAVRTASRLKYLSPLAQSQLVCTAITPDQPADTEVTLSDPTETLPPQQCPFEA